MLTPDAALDEILACCAPLPAERVELSAALQRVLCQPVIAARTLPPWDNSAMDGYAVRAADVSAGRPLPVVGTIAAGRPWSEALPAGAALRIMTGAPMPVGADAVVMREETEERGDQVILQRAPRPGEHVRRAGEDLRAGDQVLAAGAVLQPGELGLLAALGRTLCLVHRRPRVAILSTGDELIPADVAPGPGQIVDSNSHALAAQVREAGGEPLVLATAPDREDALRAALSVALRADVVLSSGGVSVGDFDFVKAVLRDLGVVERFWRVAMKPGKPLSFGVRDASDGARTLVFGLPGNPVSSMVSFELFVRPALRRLLGHSEGALRRPRAPVLLRRPIRQDPARPHFTRALVQRDQATLALWAEPLTQQGSGMLRSMVGVNALIEVPAGAAPGATLPEGATALAHLLYPI